MITAITIKNLRRLLEKAGSEAKPEETPVDAPWKAVNAAAPENSKYDLTADLTPAQAEVWRAVEKIEGPWTISEIAVKCGRSRAAVNGAVLLFEEAEMVREVSREGRRRFFSVVRDGDAK